MVTEEEKEEETILVAGGTRTRKLKKILQILKEGEEALTTTKAEFVSIACTSQAIWLRNILTGLNFKQQ